MEQRQVRRVEDPVEVHADDLEVRLRWLRGVQLVRLLQRLCACSARVRDDRVNATVRAQSDGVLEEADLRLPVGHVTVHKVNVLVARLPPNLADELAASLCVGVTHHDARAACRPLSDEACPKAARTTCYEDVLSTQPMLVVRDREIDWRGLSNSMDDRSLDAVRRGGCDRTMLHGIELKLVKNELVESCGDEMKTDNLLLRQLNMVSQPVHRYDRTA